MSPTGFWNEVSCITTERQRVRLLEGYPVFTNSHMYQVVDDNGALGSDYFYPLKSASGPEGSQASPQEISDNR